MEPKLRIKIIRLLEKMSADKEVAQRLQLTDASGFKKEE